MSEKRTNKENRALKIKYGIWLGLSREARRSAGMPIDQKEFSEKYDISEISLANWKKEDVVKETRDNSLGLFLKDATFAIYQALIKSATDTSTPKSAQDRRTFFQLTGELGKQGDKDSGETNRIEIVIERADDADRRKDKAEDKAPLDSTAELH